MVISKKKKLIAIIFAVTLLAGTIPVATKSFTTTGAQAATEANKTTKVKATAQKAGAKEVSLDSILKKGKKSGPVTKKDYTLVAESQTYKLYLYKPRLSILLENKETGKIIESTLSDQNDDGKSNASWKAYMKSGIVLSAIVGTTNTTQVDLISCKNTIQVSKIQNGFSAKIYFEKYQFGLTVNVSLDNDNLVVDVPDKSIVEDMNGTYISTVSLFPFMGYTYLDQKKGYMLIPDGNGALIDLDNKEGRFSTGFSQMIYGSDAGFTEQKTEKYLWDEIDMVKHANKVIAPVFGMAHTGEKTGYIAVVESGAQRASIEAQPNGAMVNYNRCFAKFLLRDIYVQPLNASNSGTVTEAEANRTHMDLKVRYMLLSGKDANYSGMAVKYRNYLLKNNLVSKRDTSYNTRVDFLGTDREEALLGTKAVTMTTVDNINQIYKELQSKGVSSLLTVYKGWQKGGVYDLPITNYKADSHIGGSSDLTDLITNSAKKDYKVYLYNDALRLNPSTNNFAFNIIKKINKRTFEEKVWAEVYNSFNYLTPDKTSSDLNSLVASFTKDGVSNLALSGISNTLFSYNYNGKKYSRTYTQKQYSDLISKVSGKTKLILEKPAQYLWKDTDAFLDMPLGSSDYMYVDEEVPFLSMVLKGIVPMYSEYVNFEANKKEFLLQMVESGVFPSFYLTNEDSSDLIYTNSADLYSTKYSTYKNTVIEYDKQLRALNQELKGACIVNHEKRSNGVTVVTYDNGVKVYVNYTDTAQKVDGRTVEAMSYTYDKAGETK